MKLTFNFLAKEDELSMFLSSKYLNRDGAFIKAHKTSSIWRGIKLAIADIQDKVQWTVGDGTKINLWRDNWLTNSSIQRVLGLGDSAIKGCSLAVESVLVDNHLVCSPNMQETLLISSISPNMQETLLISGLSTQNTIRSMEQDKLVWIDDLKGKFSVNKAWRGFRQVRANV